MPNTSKISCFPSAKDRAEEGSQRRPFLLIALMDAPGNPEVSWCGPHLDEKLRALTGMVRCFEHFVNARHCPKHLTWTPPQSAVTTMQTFRCFLNYLQMRKQKLPWNTRAFESFAKYSLGSGSTAGVSAHEISHLFSNRSRNFLMTDVQRLHTAKQNTGPSWLGTEPHRPLILTKKKPKGKVKAVVSLPCKIFKWAQNWVIKINNILMQ